MLQSYKSLNCKFATVRHLLSHPCVRVTSRVQVDTFLELLRAAGFTLDRQEGWVSGLGSAAFVGTDITRVKQAPDFFVGKLEGQRGRK